MLRNIPEERLKSLFKYLDLEVLFTSFHLRF